MEIGIDIVKISRFQKMLNGNLSKIFTDYEIEYIKSKGVNSIQTVAGLFACKESVLKALGLGIFSSQLFLKDIEIRHKNGKPQVEITPKLFHYINNLGLCDIKVSISHDGDYAISECIIY